MAICFSFINTKLPALVASAAAAELYFDNKIAYFHSSSFSGFIVIVD